MDSTIFETQFQSIHPIDSLLFKLIVTILHIVPQFIMQGIVRENSITSEAVQLYFNNFFIKINARFIEWYFFGNNAVSWTGSKTYRKWSYERITGPKTSEHIVKW